VPAGAPGIARQTYLWRAVDHEGEVFDMLVQRRRDCRAPLWPMRKALQVGRLLIVNGRAGVGLGSPRRGGIPGTMRVITNAGPGGEARHSARPQRPQSQCQLPFLAGEPPDRSPKSF
jgi:hypothetical protein